MTTMLLGLLAWQQGALRHPKAKLSKLLLVRMFGEIGGTFCFLTALFNIPLADATAILMAMPLAVTLGASLFFGEKVGWRRYSAIAIGFNRRDHYPAPQCRRHRHLLSVCAGNRILHGGSRPVHPEV